MADRPNLNMRIQEDKSILFDARGDVTIRVAYDSPTMVKVEMWKEGNPPLLVAPDVGNLGTKSFRDKLAKTAREVFNPPLGKDESAIDNVPDLDEDLVQIASLMGVPEISELLKPESGTTVVDRLIELVEEGGRLFTSPSGRAYGAVEVDGHTETYSLDDEPFEDFLRGRFLVSERERLQREAEKSYENMIASLGGMAPNLDIPVKRPPVLKSQTVTDAISQLKSLAKVGKRVEEVYLRVGGANGRFYIDLCNDAWEVVEVDENGWRVLQDSPIRFVRAPGMLPLPNPVKGGNLDDLRALLNMGDDADALRNWTLTVSWLVQALRPDPQHPILALKGGEGTAKSYTAYLLRFLVDPNEARDDYTYPDLRTLCINTDHQWVLVLDNVSHMPEWLSNALCKLVTGMGFRVRSLYSDRGLEIFKARRPITINGITDLGSNRDLLSRTLLVNLPVITKYRLESELEELYEEKRPGILGALLDAVSAGIKKLPELEVVGRGSRLADFDLWGRATEEALGLKPGSFLAAREGTEREAMQTALEAEPIATTIQGFALSWAKDDPYEGTPEELLAELNKAENDPNKKRNKLWPDSPDSMGSKMSKLASSLLVEGVHAEKFQFSKGDKRGKRGWRIWYADPSPDKEGDVDTLGTPKEGDSDYKGDYTKDLIGKGKTDDVDTVDTVDTRASTSEDDDDDDVGEV